MFRLSMFFYFFMLGSSVFANSLFNPSNGKLFIPYIQLDEQVVFSAELNLANSGLLEITKVEQRFNDLEPSYGTPARLTTEGTLTLPRINVDGLFFQAELALQASDNAMVLSNIQVLNEHLPERGTVLSNELKTQYTQFQLNQIISLFAFQSGLNINLQPQNDVELYKLSYQTIDPAGELTNASALLVLPVGLDTPRPLAAVQHGTRVLDSEALTEELLDVPSIGLAATGYVVVAADYLGFGDSPGFHAYNHAHSLATVVIDALRAGKTAVQDKGLQLNGQLFLAGYSEGGYATLAVQREIETHHSNEFTITASAPMAGAYDLSGSMTQRMLDASSYANPYYFAYIGLMLQQVYGLFDGVEGFFAAPYASDILTYFDGQHSSSDINNFLPDSHLDIFTTQVYEDLANADSWIAASLRANDLLRWKPEVPTRLYHCISDEQVPFSNSQVAFDSFQAFGSTQVELIKIEDTELNQGDVHANCSIPIMLMAKEWFDSF